MNFLLRLLSYLTRKAVLLSIIGALAFCAFFMAVNASNIYIVLKDGLATRVGVALGRVDNQELGKFFTSDYLLADISWRDRKYEDYTIRGYDHRMEIKSVWSWPWATTASATVTEYVRSIDGEKQAAKLTEEEQALKQKIPPPEWPHREYFVVLLQVPGGHGSTADMKELHTLPQPTPTPPRPTPAQTPSIPVTTPNPTPTPTR